MSFPLLQPHLNPASSPATAVTVPSSSNAPLGHARNKSFVDSATDAATQIAALPGSMEVQMVDFKMYSHVRDEGTNDNEDNVDNGENKDVEDFAASAPTFDPPRDEDDEDVEASLESPKDIMKVVASPPRDEDKKDVEDFAVLAPTFFPNNTPSLSPHQSKKENPKVDGRFRCPQCPDTAPRTFKRHFDIRRHIKAAHTEMIPNKKLELTCPCCYEVLSRKDAFRRHTLKVPKSCRRFALLKNRSDPPPQPESLYRLCQAGTPPAPDRESVLESSVEEQNPGEEENGYEL